MKRFAQQLVAKTKTEEFFIQLRKRVNFIRRFIPVSIRHRFTSIGKFIPHSTAYPSDDSYSLTRDNTHFIINRSDYVQWRIFYGVRDNALAEAKRRLEDGAVILDIGANFGAFSLRLARYALENKFKDVQVHAFEPNPSVATNFKNNLHLNPDLLPVVQLHEVGLGSQSQKRSFQFENSNTGSGRVTASEGNGQVSIEIRTLDDFVEQLNPKKITFIKLIVEGFEPEVLKGGWNTIVKYRPPLFLEVTPDWWKEYDYNIDEVLEKLFKLGYTFTIEHHNEMLSYEAKKYADRVQFNLMGIVC
ncbi:MAG TPA: FkbM family methyltransferase [Ohtaekwangia sp.]